MVPTRVVNAEQEVKLAGGKNDGDPHSYRRKAADDGGKPDNFARFGQN